MVTPENPVPWPNQQEPLDGVVPTRHIPQNPGFINPDADHTAVQMEAYNAD